MSRFQALAPPGGMGPADEEESAATGSPVVGEKGEELWHPPQVSKRPASESVVQPDPIEVEGVAQEEPEEEPAQPAVTSVAQVENLHWPLANASIQCGYSLSVKSATLGDWRSHLAVDLAAETGAEVRAAAAGTVSKLVTNDPYWGTYIHIDHGGGWVTSYSNIAQPRVQVGEWVAAGQVLGLIQENPPIELADDLHLHFVLLHNGQPVDPTNRWQP